MRPYIADGRRGVMLALAGALMTLAVATLKPIVNQVLLAKPAPVEAKDRASKGPSILDDLVDRLPIEEASVWLRQRPMAKVPILIVCIFRSCASPLLWRIPHEKDRRRGHPRPPCRPP